jgi:hypothetical protein
MPNDAASDGRANKKMLRGCGWKNNCCCGAAPDHHILRAPAAKRTFARRNHALIK